MNLVKHINFSCVEAYLWILYTQFSFAIFYLLVRWITYVKLQSYLGRFEHGKYVQIYWRLIQV